MTKNFEVGQIIEAIILRVVNKTHFLVSIEGTYFLIENQTAADFKPGGSLKLIVDSTTPLRMKPYKQSIDGHIHFHV